MHGSGETHTLTHTVTQHGWFIYKTESIRPAGSEPLRRTFIILFWQALAPRTPLSWGCVLDNSCSCVDQVRLQVLFEIVVRKGLSGFIFPSDNSHQYANITFIINIPYMIRREGLAAVLFGRVFFFGSLLLLQQ